MRAFLKIEEFLFLKRTLAPTLSRHTGRVGKNAFTMVELLVVIGIIGVIIALLMPALNRARMQAKAIACQSNMRQIGQAMMIYANNGSGWLFPPDDGTNGTQVSIDQRWFVVVLKPRPPLDPNDQNIQDWTPPIMICPADEPDLPYYHSYVLNHHLVEHAIRYSTKPPGGVAPTKVVVMGEEKSQLGINDDYYVETYDNPSPYSKYHILVDSYRHGIKLGSNCLYLDLHVDNNGPLETTPNQFPDPWDFPDIAKTQPTAN